MKAVILAGGLGTRISEESHLKPKPMIEIGEKPILWHIMKLYSFYGINDFIVCAGYKQQVIKEWFANYFLHNSDITFDFTNEGNMTIHSNVSEPWRVTVVDTGLNTMTGGRIKRIKQHIDDTFFLTYGDGVSDVNIAEELRFHKSHRKLVTMTAVQPEGRFGFMEILGDKITAFREKEKVDAGWINGGFMIMEPKAIDYIANDESILERAPLENIASDGELMCYKHHNFWQCMDTLRDKEKLEKLWHDGVAPWKVWDN
ncbi:MAG: glucose-1-phosphate cytidylyltransferase [Synergistaceae bacterium]